MILVSALAVLIARPAAAAPEAALERAVSAELSRAKHELKDAGYPGIYYAALNVWDVDDWDRWSAMDASRAEARMSQRVVKADVRVGSPELDNHPVSPRTDYLGTPVAEAGDEFPCVTRCGASSTRTIRPRRRTFCASRRKSSRAARPTTTPTIWRRSRPS